jgi:hypothetical protein
MATFALQPSVTLRLEETVALPGPRRSFGRSAELSRLEKKEKRQQDESVG